MSLMVHTGSLPCVVRKRSSRYFTHGGLSTCATHEPVLLQAQQERHMGVHELTDTTSLELLPHQQEIICLNMQDTLLTLKDCVPFTLAAVKLPTSFQAV